MDAFPILNEQRAKVAEADRQVEEATRRAERERAILEGMEAMAASLERNIRRAATNALRLGPTPVPPAPAPRTSGGRQPGSISKRWRAVLDDLHTFSTTGRFSVADVIEAVKRLESRTMRPAEVRRQLDKYVELEYVERAGDGNYLVTDSAVEKYAMGAGQHDENLANDAQKEEAHDSADDRESREYDL